MLSLHARHMLREAQATCKRLNISLVQIDGDAFKVGETVYGSLKKALSEVYRIDGGV